jgi:chorismate mutase
MRLLAEKQRGLVANQEDFELTRFLDLAAQREHLQNEIAAEKAKPAASPDPVNKTATKTKPVTLAPEIAEAIRSIKEVDREIEDFLSERREALYREIKNIRQGRSAIRGYRAKTSKPPRFIDKEG